MPLCGEQPENIARAKHRGYALSINVKKLNTLAKDLEVALKRILSNPSFSASAARVSHLMRAHRQTPVQKAVGELVSWRVLMLLNCGLRGKHVTCRLQTLQDLY